MTPPKCFVNRFFVSTAVILLIGCLWVGPTLASTVYIWKDEKGVTHVTNQTPPENIKEVKRLEYEPQGKQTPKKTAEDPLEENLNPQKEKLEERIDALKMQAAEALSKADKSRKIATEKKAEAKRLQNSFFANKTYVERGRLQSDIKRLLDQSADAEARAKEFQNKAELTDRRIKKMESELNKMN